MESATVVILAISGLWGLFVGLCTMDVQTRNASQDAQEAHTVRTLDGVQIDASRLSADDAEAIPFLYSHEVCEYVSR
jgi:hypothetical protein